MWELLPIASLSGSLYVMQACIYFIVLLCVPQREEEEKEEENKKMKHSQA